MLLFINDDLKLTNTFYIINWSRCDFLFINSTCRWQWYHDMMQRFIQSEHPCVCLHRGAVQMYWDRNPSGQLLINGRCWWGFCLLCRWVESLGHITHSMRDQSFPCPLAGLDSLETICTYYIFVASLINQLLSTVLGTLMEFTVWVR